MLICFLFFSLCKWNCQVKALAALFRSVSAETLCSPSEHWGRLSFSSFYTRLSFLMGKLWLRDVIDWFYWWSCSLPQRWSAAPLWTPGPTLLSCIVFTRPKTFGLISFFCSKAFEAELWKYGFIISARIRLISQKSKCLYVISTISR